MLMPSVYDEQHLEVQQWKRRVTFVGVTLLLMMVFQTATTLLLGAPLHSAKENMTASLAARLAYYGLYNVFYCACLLLPAVVAALIFRQPPTTRATMRRAGGLNIFLYVLFGLAICILANYIVAYWLQFVELFGVQPYNGGYNNDSGILPLCLNLFTYAVVPGVVEELVFRGWLLGALRPFGERRALFLSALIFGLAHSNLTQLPFAFILGLMFGFIFLRTGRLWPSMLIHALNNAMAVVLVWAQQNTSLSEGEGLGLQVAVMTALAFLGAVAGILLYTHPAAVRFTQPLQSYRRTAPKRVYVKWLWLSPLPIAMLIMAIEILLVEVLR